MIEMLNSIKGPIAALADLSDCLVLAETGDDAEICYLELWHTREGMDHHLNSPLYRRVLEAMELSRVPPIVEFYEVNKIGGMELIEAVRNLESS